MPLNERASLLAAQIADHAHHKNERLALTGATDFMLLYVRPPGSGMSDFSFEIIETVFDYLASDANLPHSLVGVVLLNVEGHSGEVTTRSRLWDRSNALPASLRAAVTGVYVAEPRVTPEARHAKALAAPAATLRYVAARCRYMRSPG